MESVGAWRVLPPAPEEDKRLRSQQRLNDGNPRLMLVARLTKGLGRFPVKNTTLIFNFICS